jgi:hypothetical protein
LNSLNSNEVRVYKVGDVYITEDEVKESGLKLKTIKNRIRTLKWSKEDALGRSLCKSTDKTGYLKKKAHHEINGVIFTREEIDNAAVSYSTLVNRIHDHWDKQRALTEPPMNNGGRPKGFKKEKKRKTVKQIKEERKVKSTLKEEIKKFKKVALANGVPLDVYMHRVYNDKVPPSLACLT